MSRFHRRPVLVIIAMLAACVAVLFPPWRARAIRTTTRYAAVTNVEPSTVVDTIAWPLAFAPLFARPRAEIGGERMRDLAVRATRGDRSARDSLRLSTAAVERRYQVPEILRADGQAWRDSVLTAAGIPAVSSYDLTFTLDQRWIAGRLAAVALIAFALDLRARRARRHTLRDGYHEVTRG